MCPAIGQFARLGVADHNAPAALETLPVRSKTRGYLLPGRCRAAAFPHSLNLLVLDNGAGHKVKAVRWPANVVPVFLPPYSHELNPMERLWRDLKDKLADIPVKTIAELSDALCTIIQHYSHATLHSLTSFAYFVQAVETAQKAIYG